MRLWLALALAAAAVLLAAWIYLPAPTYVLLYLSVGAPEVCQWILAGALVAAVLAGRDVASSSLARTVLGMSGVAVALGVTPLARLPATARRFREAMRGLSAEPATPARSRPFSMLDLVRGIPAGRAAVTRGIEFARPAGVPLHVDVWRPRSRGSFPILVQIYGGAWQRGEPGRDANFANWLASNGWVVFAIDYRHAPAFQWPAQSNDVDSALTWIHAHAGEFDGDTSRVVLMGRSAGAHLAMMAAFRPRRMPIRGVVSYYGPIDLVDSYRHPPRPDPLNIPDVSEKFIGGPLVGREREYAEASPLTHATGPLPPTLLVYATRDNVIEARYGRQLRDRLAANGTSVAYLEIPWAGHGFDNVFNGPSSQLALYYTERFLTWAVTGRPR